MESEPLLYQQTPNVTLRKLNFSLEALRQCNYDDWIVLSNLVAYCSYDLAAQNTKRVQVSMEKREGGTKEVPLVFYDLDVRLPPDCWIESTQTNRLHGLSISRLLRCAHHLSVQEQCAMLSLTLASNLNPIDTKGYCVTQFELLETKPSTVQSGALMQFARTGPDDEDDRGILKRPRTTATTK
jgi:hypothetical protein